ncbi:mediator-associated protein 1-like [Dorcoceras hygrometricum]|uniref:Mediator-associated protein 1-like n=1 Tax=Dorcoceras hygrometricum TaxID=472368 RepID=A0A2Z7ARN1_9LAMI|nr:mediator-associated protein 1-like [Dorcoceras hygrometricum]
MGCTDPNKTKAGNKYEVKPQYEELSKQINMQYAINQCYECMRVAKEISQLGQCINRQIKSNRLYTTVYQPGNHRSVIIETRRSSQPSGISRIHSLKYKHVHALTAKGCSNSYLNFSKYLNRFHKKRPATNSSSRPLKLHGKAQPKILETESVQGTNIPEQSSNQRKKTHPKLTLGRAMHGATYCPKLSSFALLSQLKTASKVGRKKRSFQEVSNATKNLKNGGRNQRKFAIESYGE